MVIRCITSMMCSDVCCEFLMMIGKWSKDTSTLLNHFELWLLEIIIVQVLNEQRYGIL